MKKLLLFVLAVMGFAACTNDPVEEQSAIRQDAPETITVGFEGDDTRIQLNEAQKTVWTNGDQVSVFYFSDANQLWQYNGETGSRTANLKRVNAGEPTAQTTYNVVAYPFNEGYFLNTRTGALHATLPATQHYLKDSYGVGDNLMVSQSEFTQFSLKNVCGWLKLQLTGNGEVVKSITFKGKDGEQVAGLIYVDTATAEATLAAEMGSTEDNNAGGNLVFDDTIVTEVTLDCGEGVTLGAEATAFYIAIPPQTFEKGFKVEILCADDTKMVKSSNKAMSIERNHIQPMTAMEFTPPVPNNQIWYTSSDGNIVKPFKTNVFGATIISNEYNNGMGVITFGGDVTSIGKDAFYNRDSLTSVNIPDSVTTIGENAFAGCTSLTSVNIPNSVTTIGENAFECCTSLTSVSIPNSVTTIGNSAFYYCTSLTEFNGKFAEDNGKILVVDGVLAAFAPAGITEYTIPDSVTSIGEWAFGECTRLTSVTIGDSVTSIGYYAFYYCTGLTSVNIPDSVTTIGGYAFYSCDSLTSVNIPDSVTTIGEFAFDFCESLTSITIPNSVTTIGENVFANCYSLTSVTIGDGVTTIVHGAFAYCKSLTSVTIPDNVTTIGDDAFFLCERLTSITIPDSVTTIGAYAFSLCKSIESVTLPNSVTTIGNWAFNSCSSLTSVTIGDGVTTIGYGAFYYCNSLTSVYCKAVNPPALDGSAVFDFNGSGRKIYVPVKSADAYMSAQYWSEYASDIVGYDFENGTVMETVQNNEIWYTSSDGNVVTPNNRSAFGTNIVSNTYSNGKGIITFEGDVTKIGDEAFAYCPRLTSITIPYNVTTIGKNAFAYCTNLTEFKGKFAEDNGRILVVDGALKAFAPAGISEYTIHDSVKTIGDFAFYDCDSLTSITIPNSVKTIKGYTFYDCDNLKSVTIGNSVTTIGDGAFAYCYSLKSVYCKATTPPTLESSYVFYYNSSSLKIYVPTESVDAYKSAQYWSEYADKIVGYNF